MLVCSAVDSYADGSALPFNLKHYGNYKAMINDNRIEGAVSVRTALAGKHVYALGAIKNAEGEITVYDDTVWLSYGKDGLNKAIHDIPEGEEAMLLVTAEVKTWKEVTIPLDMDESALYQFILKQADIAGLDTKKAFPFVIEGGIKDLTWHVIKGVSDGKTENRGHHGHASSEYGSLEKHAELVADVDAILVGFYSADSQGVFTHPGESWHSHVIFTDNKKAGHVEKFGVRNAAVLKFPML